MAKSRDIKLKVIREIKKDIREVKGEERRWMRKTSEREEARNAKEREKRGGRKRRD